MDASRAYTLLALFNLLRAPIRIIGFAALMKANA
jgi:hypothetical protein